MNQPIIDPVGELVSIVTIATGLPAELIALAERAKSYADSAKAAATRKAYDSDWRHFEAWCSARGIEAMPAHPIGAVLAYLTAHAGTHKVSTLQRRLVAIRECHRGFELDTSSVAFRDTWKGLRREEGRARPVTKKAPLMTATLRRAVHALPDKLIGYRDRALLLIGFAAGLRRSELASLEVSQRDGAAGWVEQMPDGLAIRLAYSKTDQDAQGDTVGVPFAGAEDICPVKAYRAWLEKSGISEGPVFRWITRHGKMGEVALSSAAIAIIVKRAVVRAALTEGMTTADAIAMAEDFSGHSLSSTLAKKLNGLAMVRGAKYGARQFLSCHGQAETGTKFPAVSVYPANAVSRALRKLAKVKLRAGHATSAVQNDAPGHAIQRQLRHKSFNTTAGYIREGRLFKGSSASFALR